MEEASWDTQNILWGFFANDLQKRHKCHTLTQETGVKQNNRPKPRCKGAHTHTYVYSLKRMHI